MEAPEILEWRIAIPPAEPIIAMRMFRPPLKTVVELAGGKPVSVPLRKRWAINKI
jgi:hypothetical protein